MGSRIAFLLLAAALFGGCGASTTPAVQETAAESSKSVLDEGAMTEAGRAGDDRVGSKSR